MRLTPLAGTLASRRILYFAFSATYSKARNTRARDLINLLLVVGEIGM
jgi:hypothetical protein